MTVAETTSMLPRMAQEADEEVLTKGRYVRLSFKELSVDEKDPARNFKKLIGLSALLLFLAYCALFWTAIFEDLFVADTSTLTSASSSRLRHVDLFSCCETEYPMTVVGDEICTGQIGGTHFCCLVCKAEIAIDAPPLFDFPAKVIPSLPPVENKKLLPDQAGSSHSSTVSFLDKAACCVLRQPGDDEHKGSLRCPEDGYNKCCKVC